MPGSCSSLPLGFSKRRCHGRRFRKRAAELVAAAAAVVGSPGSLSAGSMGSLSAAGLTGSSEPAAAASAPGGNLIKICVEFRDFG